MRDAAEIPPDRTFRSPPPSRRQSSRLGHPLRMILFCFRCPRVTSGRVSVGRAFRGSASVERQHLNVMSSLSSLFIIYPPKLHSVSAAQHAGYADAIGGFATSTLLLTPPVRPTLLPDFASDACAVGMSHGARCRCSNALLPLHAAPGWAPACSRARHTPTLRQYTACLRCPFSLFSPFARALCLPARRRLSWRGPRALAGRRGTCGFPLSRPRLPRDVHAVGVGSASAHVVGARRLSGARSLPIAHTGEFSLVGGQALTCGSWACDVGRAACGRVATGLRRGRGPRRSEGCRSPWVRPG